MKKLLSIILASLILVSGAVSATAATISELESRQAELEAQKAEYQKQLNQSNAKVNEQQENVDALVGQVESVTEEIQISYKKIALLDEDIAKKEEQIGEKNKEIEANMDVLRQRIKTIYISGDVSSLEIILGAKDFTDFLDKLQLVEYVSNHDEALIQQVQKQLDAISAEKKALEDDKAAQEKEQATLKERQDELNTLLEENKEILAGLQSEANSAQMSLSLSEEELSGLSAEIQEYYRQQREALAAQQAAAAAEASGGGSSSSGSSSSGSSSSGGGSSSSGGSSYSDPGAATQIDAGGGWVWPTPGSHYITSQYGEARSYESHNAIDIGASTGTPIYAANSGTVTSSYSGCTHSNSGSNWCSCGGGYGNYVWILHNNGYETIYGHMISTAVSTGQSVSAGQLIGYVGSTGWSTGPHLHFELRIGGVKSNPMNLY